MAVDTAEKRRAASGVPFLPVGPGVTPESTKDADWRKQSAWSYAVSAAALGSTLMIATRGARGDEYTRGASG